MVTMNIEYLKRKAKEFDSDQNKKEALATYIRMYLAEFSQGKRSMLELKRNIEGLSDYFIKIDFRFGKNQLETIRDYVLIEKFF